MRRFRIYIPHDRPDEESYEEFQDDATDEEIERRCDEALGAMVSNMDSGWYEIDEEGDG